MMGFDKFIWFIGVVEDGEDPTNNGRVRVRALNVHPIKNEDVPTAHLPWATVVDGTYGVSQVIPSVGEWVIGFFVDGIDCQHPMIIGRLPGTMIGTPEGSGLPGSSGYIPPEAMKNFGKPPLHSYIGGEDCEEGQAPLQAAAQKSGIKTAIYKNKKGLDEKDEDKRVKFSEPNILTPERNLDSRVIKSKEGNNVIVLNESEDGDGTTILISHSSGSVFQIDPHGTIFIKSFGDTYNSSEGFEFNRIDKDSHTNVGGDWSLKVESGSGRIEIQGDLDILCNNFNVDARASVNINAGTSFNMSGAKVGMIAVADDVNISALNQIKIQTVGIPFVKSGNIIIKAPLGDLNIDSYATNMFSHSYIAMTALALPDYLAITPTLAVPNVLGAPIPKLPLTGIDINTPTYINLTSGLKIDIQSLGTVTTTAGLAATMQSAGAAQVLGLLGTKMSSGGSATITGLTANMSSGVSSTVFSFGKSSLTGLASASVFSAGKADLTAGGAASVFGGGKASMTGGGVVSVNGSVAFVGGGVTLLGTPGLPAIPGTPGLPGIPGIPVPPAIPWPALVNLAEFGAAVIPESIPGTLPFTGYKADNRLGQKTPITITSRSNK